MSPGGEGGSLPRPGFVLIVLFSLNSSYALGSKTLFRR